MDPTQTGTARPGTATRARVEVCGSDRPRLARHVRLGFCPTRKKPILLLPETVVVLNTSGADILELCDGHRSVADIVDELGRRYDRVVDDEVTQFLARLAARRWVAIEEDTSADD
jgi:pyrroloquinoline quinone biosynthesis protein D